MKTYLTAPVVVLGAFLSACDTTTMSTAASPAPQRKVAATTSATAAQPAKPSVKPTALGPTRIGTYMP